MRTAAATKTRTFKSPDFGAIRTAGTSENPLFCMQDLYKAMGLSATSAKSDRLHDKADWQYVETKYPNGRNGRMIFLTISGLRDVLVNSHSGGKGDLVYQWISRDVLPVVCSGKKTTETDDEVGPTYTFTQIADELGVKVVDLISLLYKHKVLTEYDSKTGLHNVADEYVKQDFVAKRRYPNYPGRITTVWTEAGRKFLLSHIKHNGATIEMDETLTEERAVKAAENAGKPKAKETPAPQEKTQQERGKIVRIDTGELKGFFDAIQSCDDIISKVDDAFFGATGRQMQVDRFDTLCDAVSRCKSAIADIMKDAVIFYGVGAKKKVV